MIINERKIGEINFIDINNENGMVIVLSSFGASIFQIETLDKYKRLEPILLTPVSLENFYYSTGYFGKTIGRFSGRIKDAKLKINDKEYFLDKNWNNINSLHGGNDGLSFKNFDYKIIKDDEFVYIFFSLFEKESTIPGDINYEITYRISANRNEFTIFYKAVSNADTILNLTNHSYFNLSGNMKQDILDEELTLFADKYTLLDDNLIPISIEKVTEITDFQKSKKIGKHINDDSLQNHISKGYDHCFIKKDLNEPVIAILKDKKSKRKMIIETSYPAIVCYTYNYPIDIDFNNYMYTKKYQAITFECQYVPNDIKSALLKKDEVYNHYITYKFYNK